MLRGRALRGGPAVIRCERIFTEEDGAAEPYQCPEAATVPVLVGDHWAHCCASCARSWRRRSEPPDEDAPRLPPGRGLPD